MLSNHRLVIGWPEKLDSLHFDESSGQQEPTCPNFSSKVKSVEGQLVLLILLFLLFPLPARADITAGQLFDRCQKRTKVMERVNEKLTTVGEHLDSYCEGYLIGVYNALMESKIICAPPKEVPNSEYLKSVFEFFLKDQPGKKDAQVAAVLKDAYTRVFSCKKK